MPSSHAQQLPMQSAPQSSGERSPLIAERPLLSIAGPPARAETPAHMPLPSRLLLASNWSTLCTPSLNLTYRDLLGDTVTALPGHLQILITRCRRRLLPLACLPLRKRLLRSSSRSLLRLYLDVGLRRSRGGLKACHPSLRRLPAHGRRASRGIQVTKCRSGPLWTRMQK